MNDNSYNIGELFNYFIKNIGLILAASCFLYLFAAIGSVILFIPTFIGLTMLLLIPIFSDQERIKDVLQQTWKVILKDNIFILLDLLIIISLNLLVWSAISNMIQGFNNNLFVYIILRAFLNALILPLIYIYLTLKYRTITV
ncbi:hypothetical protein [Falsibacillus albus]|nr:hypothetical protein [Falsibacillus albus]